MKAFIEKNWLFISGLLAGLVLSLQQFVGKAEIDWKAVGFAVLMATVSYFANEWKGKGLSFMGIVGTMAYNFVTIQATGTFSWDQFILSSALAILAAGSELIKPTTKPLPYETKR